MLRSELAAIQRRGALPSKMIGAARVAAVGAVMTMQRASDCGYEVTNCCPLCGQPGDTLFHRVYRCPATRELVKAVVPGWFWRDHWGFG